MINAEIVLATRGHISSTNGLITFVLDIPSYIHTELLTHKRLARNSSSARAQSTKRHLGNGFYMPDIFYKDQKGMQSSDEPIECQEKAQQIYKDIWFYCQEKAKDLELLGVTKEQRNRIIPPIKMVKTVATGTEDAWRKFLELRNNPEADKAMQLLAEKINLLIDILDINDQWELAYSHIPFLKEEDYDKTNQELVHLSAARLARISYDKPKEGKNDIDLAKELITKRHLSPFEHIAFWQKDPKTSALCSKEKDKWNDFGWTNYRSILENF